MGNAALDGYFFGEVPDVQVELTPEDWLAERDPQLDKAIEMLKDHNGQHPAE